MVELDLADETAKRTQANKYNLSEIFTPYAIAYTSGDNDNKGGRTPSDQKTNKTDYDKGYNKNRY